MPKKVVISAPDGWGDAATDLWCPAEAVYFARQVQQAGYEPVVLRGSQAVKSNYDAAVSDPDAVMVTGVGHGNNTTFTGYRLAVLERCPVPQGKYDNKVWCPVSCLVGNQLAPEIVQKSANAASVGEVTEYWFYADPTVPHKGEDPEKEDPYLWTFQEPEFSFRLALLNGATLKEAWDLMGQRYKYWRDYWYQKGLPDVGDTAWYDWINRRRWGTDDWRIGPPRRQVQLLVTAKAVRDACRRVDVVTVEGGAVSDGQRVSGTFTVRVDGQERTVRGDGFSLTFELPVDRNETKQYGVSVEFKPDDPSYQPASARLAVTAEPSKCVVQIQITGVDYKVSGPLMNEVTAVIKGIVLAGGKPLPSAQVEVGLCDGGCVNTYVTTDEGGSFEASLRKTLPPFPSGFTVYAKYDGDEWNSADYVTERVRVADYSGLAGIIAFIIALILAILSYIR
jgi:hypothetical protein